MYHCIYYKFVYDSEDSESEMREVDILVYNVF